MDKVNERVAPILLGVLYGRNQIHVSERTKGGPLFYSYIRNISGVSDVLGTKVIEGDVVKGLREILV